jgi:CubicO group peptidase (beta-lactamase class C family)
MNSPKVDPRVVAGPPGEAGSAVDAALAQATVDGLLPGVVAVATTDAATLYAGAFGARDLSTLEPMTVDTVFMMASMTKLVTSIAAMQLVEQGRIALDEPLGRLMEALAEPLVLEGFDKRGAPILRKSRRPLTLRQLLTHTSGFGHEAWSPPIGRYQDVTGSLPESSRTNASLHMPLLFDPGERWEYGIGLEWVGKAIEAVSGESLGRYFRDHITGPLGMKDTTFGVAPQHRGRIARVHRREPDGTLRPIDISTAVGEYESGGGGLYGTAGDYLTFLRMLLNGGRHGDLQILKPETVTSIIANHIGSIDVVTMRSAMPAVSNDFELFPGRPKKWGLGALVNVEAVPDGRSAGSFGWGGVANCYYWLDPSARRAGVFMTQILPFGDPTALSVFGTFEQGIYGLSK